MTPDEKRERQRRYTAAYRERNREKVRASDLAAKKNQWAKRKNDPAYLEKQKDYRLRTTYGITLADKQRLLEFQGGKCAICLKDIRGYKEAHVDHNHSTDEVRGLLCYLCNVRLGVYENVQRDAFDNYLVDPPARLVLL